MKRPAGTFSKDPAIDRMIVEKLGISLVLLAACTAMLWARQIVFLGVNWESLMAAVETMGRFMDAGSSDAMKQIVSVMKKRGMSPVDVVQLNGIMPEITHCIKAMGRDSFLLGTCDTFAERLMLGCRLHQVLVLGMVLSVIWTAARHLAGKDSVAAKLLLLLYSMDCLVLLFLSLETGDVVTALTGAENAVRPSIWLFLAPLCAAGSLYVWEDAAVLLRSTCRAKRCNGFAS